MQQTQYVPGQRWAEYRRTTGSLKKKVVLQEVEKNVREKERVSMNIESAPTLYEVPAVPISKVPGTTNKMISQVLNKQEEIDEDAYVERCAPATIPTLNLIHQIVRESRIVPLRIIVSTLRWIAEEDLLRHVKYCPYGIAIPIVQSDGPCNFDVRVYGAYI